MKGIVLLPLVIMLRLTSFAQELITESVPVQNQESLVLDFAFANDIIIKRSVNQEVRVEVSVLINEGANNELFVLKKEVSEHKIKFEMDMEPWKKLDRRNSSNCRWESELFYTVFLPEGMTLKAETISGNFILEAFEDFTELKTISGDIDLTIGKTTGLSFIAKTISGEVYSDCEIEFPDGNDGLHQLVGLEVKGRIRDGKLTYHLESISGNIYLRKG